MKTTESPWSKNLFSDSVEVDFGSGKYIVISGMGSEKWTDGEILFEGDTKSQTTHAFEKINKALSTHGADRSNIIKIVAYLTDIRNKSFYEKELQKFFEGLKMPVHTLLEVSNLAWPGMLIEIEVTAFKKN